MADAKTLLRAQKQKKIDHPLAKYNNIGGLSCVLCNCPVKSEALWQAHLLSKRHKDALQAAEQRIQQQGTKRAGGEDGSAAKKAKGLSLDYGDDDDDGDDATAAPTAQAATESKASTGDTMATKLPEGFFDDARAEAKVRKVVPRNAKEEEWAKFQAEIEQETEVAEALIEEDMEEAMEERMRGEIAEQIVAEDRVAQWKSKFLAREKPSSKPAAQAAPAPVEDAEDDEDFDEMLGWRSKGL
eukprot:m.135661 g.135661  ORF g.135661 m.135661 type:complete len:242 (-) comp9532_c0_seq2:1535-2260(-)